MCLLLAEFQGLLSWLIAAILCTDQNVLAPSFLRTTDQNLISNPKEEEKERSHHESRNGPPYKKVPACLGWHPPQKIRSSIDGSSSQFTFVDMGIPLEGQIFFTVHCTSGPMLSSEPISPEEKKYTSEPCKQIHLYTRTQHQEAASWVVIPFLNTPYSKPITVDL